MILKAKDRNARVSPIQANWLGGVQATYEFKTDIIESRDGTEHRSALRQNPRVSITPDVFLTRPELTRLQADAVQTADEIVWVRVEWTQQRVAVSALAGTAALAVAEVPSWAKPGTKLIVTTTDREDLHEIDSVVGNTLLLVDPLLGDTVAGSKIHQALPARPDAKARLRQIVDRVQTGRIRFDLVPGEATFGTDYGIGHLFEGREMLLDTPDWSKPPSVTILQGWETFDTKVGRTTVVNPKRSDHLQHQYGYTATTNRQAERLIRFFLRHKGRRSMFWSPSWEDTVLPSETPLAAMNQFQVDGPEFREAYEGSPVFAVMVAFWNDGFVQANRLASIGGTSDSVLTFEDDWRLPIESSTKIRWLLPRRFDSDRLQVDWETSEVARMNFVFKTVYEQPPKPGLFAGVQDVSNDFLFYDIGQTVYPGGRPIAAAQSVGYIVAPNLGTANETDDNVVQDIIDLYEFGFTEADFAREHMAAGINWSGRTTSATGTLAAIALTFHKERPTDWQDQGLTPTFARGSVLSNNRDVYFLPDTDESFTNGLFGIPKETRYLHVRCRASSTSNLLSTTRLAWFVAR